MSYANYAHCKGCDGRTFYIGEDDLPQNVETWHLECREKAQAACAAAERPSCPAGECDGYGGIIVSECTCGTGPGGYCGMHEPGCGYEPCPAGCRWVPYDRQHGGPAQ